MHTGRVATMFALALLGAAIAAEAAGVTQEAHATSPGKNGRIAFRRYFDDAQTWGAVFVANADGTGVRQVTHPQHGVVDDQPDWSPDGSLLVFTRCGDPSTPCAVYTVQPDGSKLQRISAPRAHDPADDANASFAADGRHITFTRSTGHVRSYAGGDQIQHSDVAEMDLKGKHRRALVHAAPYQADLLFPMLSPDGSRFLYEDSRSYYAREQKLGRAIVVAKADGTGRKQITPWSLDAGDNPDWSPDGSRILFHSYDDDDDSTQAQIFTIAADGSDLRQLTHFPPGTFVGSPSFSPDGTTIVYATAPPGGRADILVMNADGSDPRPLITGPAWDSAPDWGGS
jgi:Tol biopolymer transport system component